jgi:CubicO group peptidase (beta-lactamase class C family)
MTSRKMWIWFTLLVGAAGAVGLGCGGGQPPLASAVGDRPGGAAAASSSPAEPAGPAGPVAPSASAPVAGSAEELIGVWAHDLVHGTTATGPIELTEQNGAWTLSAMGKRGACQPDAATNGQAGGKANGKGNNAGAGKLPALACALGDSGHSLRLPGGGPATNGGEVTGLWMQPEVPSLARGSYVTQVTLRAQAAGRFTGESSLLAPRLHFVLAIGKRPSGEITAFVRERERNLGRFLGLIQVRRTGDRVELAGAGGMSLEAKLVAAASAPEGRQVLEIPLPDSPFVLRLVRQERGDVVGAELFPPASPPPPRDAAAKLAAPEQTNDGWAVASPEEVAMASAPLAQLGNELARQVPGAWTDLAVHSVVVAKRGKLVYERYFIGHGRDDTHDIRSVGKSYGTTLLGTAVDRRELSLDEPVLGVLGRAASPHAADPRWQRLRVRHLAAMSSGLTCDDEASESPGEEDRVQQGAEPNWHRATLALAMEVEPGTRGVYCTMGINLLGALLEKRSAAWLPALLVERLAEPLQMQGYRLNLMPTGQGYLGGGLRLRPRDMAKLAQLYVGKGLWNGKRVLSEAWTKQATARHASLNTPDDYGLGWWRRTFEVNRTAYPAFYASGNGGQLIIGIPSLEAVVVFTAGNYGNGRTWQRILTDLMPRYVIPALAGRP